MVEWILSNQSTLLVGAVVAAIIALAAFKILRDKKKGKGSCGCNCENCPSAGKCRTK